MRKKEVFQLKTNTNKVMSGEVYYNAGGMNYFTGDCLKRGYYFSVTPKEIGEHFVTVAAFTGTCTLLTEAERFSQKTLDSITVPDDIKKQLIDHVLQKNKLTSMEVSQ